MADTKISALTSASTPLAGTEVLPIVQSSTTKQVSVANLTAGRAISATQITLTTGNVIVASGQGIDFSATSHPAGMTSELFADYEEGTWTPTVTGGITSPTYSENQGNYTKIGNTVRCQMRLGLSGGTGSGAQLNIGGLPYATNATFNGAGFNGYMDVNAVATYWYLPQGGNTNALGYLPGGANAIAAGAMAGLSINAVFIYST